MKWLYNLENLIIACLQNFIFKIFLFTVIPLKVNTI